MNPKTTNNASFAGLKKAITSLAVVTLATVASASVTMFPDGDFESPAGGAGPWLENNCCGSYVYSYPSTGGNPTGFGIIDNSGGGGYGIWVNETTLAAMGLVAGQTYTFVQDMKIISGTSIGGLKIDFVPSGSTGDMRPASGTGAWATYTYSVTIPLGTTGLKAVPLWGPNSSVAFDNMGVSIPVTPVAVAITSPANSATVGVNYAITANASVSPGTVTNVDFFDGATLLGNATSSPFVLNVSGAAPGAHALQAIALDSGGNSATSSVVNITVSTNVIFPYENFNYATGSFANGTASSAAGFSGNWTVGNGTIVAGLNYANLPSGSNAISTTGSRDQVSFASPLSSGTKDISFLFNQLGNNGGNLNGLFLPGSGSTSLIVGLTAPYSGTAGSLGLGAVATAGPAATGITTFSGQQINGGFTYNQTHLIVLKIDFDTSGANDTVSLWLDPVAGAAAPVGAANLTWSAYDVGSITGVGFNTQGGGNADQFDEIRVGDTYGDVVGGNGVVVPPVTTASVTVDPAKTWFGYMNVSELPVNGGAPVFGSTWGTVDLNASFVSTVAVLAPNTSIFRDVALSDSFWWQGDGTGNKTMDANFYVEDNTLAGKTVTFSGFCWTNSLVAPYTSQAFIKELDPTAGYATVNIVTTNLSSPTFSLTTVTTAGHIVQYGFETVGPNANTALTPLVTLGNVLVASNAQPAGPAIISLPAQTYVNVTSNTSITVSATGSGLSYQWKKNGVNLSNGSGVSGVTTTTLALNNVSGSAEANYSVVVTDSSSRTVTGNSFLVVFTPDNLSFDPNATLNGYINAFDINTLGYVTGFPFPTAQLRASINNGVASFSPNVSLNNPADAFWANPDGTPNKMVEADYFINNDGLAGLSLTFNGYCPSSTVDAAFVTSAWITAFAPDYSSNTTIVTNLVAGQMFSITLATGAGTHIQYGLRMFGPDYAATNALTSGATLMTIVPPTLLASRSATSTSLSFDTVGGHSYLVQYKNNLTDSTWQPITTVSGTGSTVSVTDTTGVAHRFYRLTAQ